MLMPVLGGLMVVFLPFIGLYLTAKAALSPLVGMFRRSAQDLAATVTPGWQPGEAHFTGKRPEEKATDKAPSKQVNLEQLARRSRRSARSRERRRDADAAQERRRPWHGTRVESRSPAATTGIPGTGASAR